MEIGVTLPPKVVSRNPFSHVASAKSRIREELSQLDPATLEAKKATSLLQRLSVYKPHEDKGRLEAARSRELVCKRVSRMGVDEDAPLTLEQQRTLLIIVLFGHGLTKNRRVGICRILLSRGGQSRYVKFLLEAFPGFAETCGKSAQP